MFGIVDNYAQGVSPPKGGAVANDPMPVKLIVQPFDVTLTGTFVAPAQGKYLFVLQGAGGSGSADAPGGPGSLAARTVRLPRGQSVAYTVSSGSGWSSSQPRPRRSSLLIV